MNVEHESTLDLIIVGAGMTGLSAARQALRSGLRTASIEALLFGGLVVNVNELDGGISGSGADLASDLMMEISDLGGEILSESVTAIACEGDRFAVTTDAGAHHARAVIVASGARLKRLGIPGESEFEHRGVAQCADCDGPMYKDQEVVVVGGGDSALQEALVLAEFCRHVHLVHRGAGFRARAHLVDAVLARANIVDVPNSVPEAILGSDNVERVRIRDIATGASSEIACAGVFAYIGLEPACDFVPADLARDANGFLLTDPSLETGMPGLFAAGAVRSGYGGLLSHAIAEGQAAAQAVSSRQRSRK